MSFNRRSFLAGLIACPVCAGFARAQQAPHWAYEGHGGAGDWGALDDKFKACAVGAEQSPIDLRNAVKSPHIGDLKIDWTPEAFAIVNNGHTIQANASAPASLTLDGQNFALKQFHFHTPSEHALDGKRMAMEAHFVHAAPTGGLAVVGVFIKAGGKHTGFSTIMTAAPKQEGSAKLAAALDPKQFLPASQERFRYEGSLTTPPCSEVVDWNVFDEAIEADAQDIAAFHAIFSMNARPLQAQHRRFLLEGA